MCSAYLESWFLIIWRSTPQSMLIWNVMQIQKVWANYLAYTGLEFKDTANPSMLVTCFSYVKSCTSENCHTKGTGFIGSLLWNNRETVVLVTVHHVIPDVITARNSIYTFTCGDKRTPPVMINVKGEKLINDFLKMSPKDMVCSLIIFFITSLKGNNRNQIHYSHAKSYTQSINCIA